MTERPLFTVDPGESDTATKLDKETNVVKSIKSRKHAISETYDPTISYDSIRQSGTGKFQVSNKLRLPPSGELNLSGKRLTPSALFSLIGSRGYDLKKLDLSGIYLDCFSRLEELNLPKNPLHRLGVHAIHSPGGYTLKKLHLSGWGLTEQHLKFLTYLHGLEELNLSNNPLHHIKLYTSKSMPDLRTLDISSCGLADKDLKDFALWNGVEELNLSNNPLSHMLQYPKNLRKLNLSGCCLTKWPPGLEECSSLEELDLSNNSFGHQDLLENLPPSVSGLSNLNRIMFEDAVYTKNDKG